MVYNVEFHCPCVNYDAEDYEDDIIYVYLNIRFKSEFQRECYQEDYYCDMNGKFNQAFENKEGSCDDKRYYSKDIDWNIYTEELIEDIVDLPDDFDGTIDIDMTDE